MGLLYFECGITAFTTPPIKKGSSNSRRIALIPTTYVKKFINFSLKFNPLSPLNYEGGGDSTARFSVKGQMLDFRLPLKREIFALDIFINCNWVVTRWQYTFTHKQYIEQH